MTLENTTIPDCGCLDTDARRCFELRYPKRIMDEYESTEVCGCTCHDNKWIDVTLHDFSEGVALRESKRWRESKLWRRP